MWKPLLLAFLLSEIHATEISVGIAALLPTTTKHPGASCFKANTPAKTVPAHPLETELWIISRSCKKGMYVLALQTGLLSVWLESDHAQAWGVYWKVETRLVVEDTCHVILKGLNVTFRNCFNSDTCGRYVNCSQHPVALTLWERASIGQNSDVTTLNVTDRHHVDSLLFNKVVKKCW